MNNDTPSKNRLSETLRAETSQLKRAWAKHSSEFLNSYLVANVQNPRINVQSILTRHFLIKQLFPDYDCDYLMDHELRFALTANWLLGLTKSSTHRHEITDQLNLILEALLDDTENLGPTDVPKFLKDMFRHLSFPNYISDLLSWAPRDDCELKIPDYLLNTFQKIWSQTLEIEAVKPISTIEPACGSANDYRFICAYGLEKFLQYTGFDLSEKNISNAKAMFHGADFQVGNVFEIEADDKAYEYCFVHDLLEHLSAEGIERAVREICRVTSKKICIHFFNMDDSGSHQIRKNGHYHWNRLSRKQLLETFAATAEKIETIHIDTFLKDRFAYPNTHNKHSWTWSIDLVQ